MENTRYISLPLAGKIQHGIRTEKGIPKELGYFIATTKEEQMNVLVKKFNNIYGENPVKIKVHFFNEEPFTVRNARYNQSGLTCYCMLGEQIGKEKVNKKWKEKECLSTCEYAKSSNDTKPLCTKEGTLKFLLPEISNDRVWILKIKGITVINRIQSYIESQKLLGNSMIGDFYLYLTQEKHIRQFDGNVFKNFTLDILKAEDEIISQEVTVNSIQEEKSVESKQTVENINSKAKKTDNKKRTQKVNKNENQNVAQEIMPTENKETTELVIFKDKKEDNKKQVKKSNKDESQANNSSKTKESKIETAKEGEYDFDRCYYFMNTEPTTINVNGKAKEYTIAKFMDMNDTEVLAIVKNEIAEELKECDIGTVMILDIIENSNKKWVTNCKFVQKCQKEIAA